MHQYYFKRKRDKIFEIEVKKFNQLNESLKFFVIQSFYFQYRHLLKKEIRSENIRNLIKILNNVYKKGKEMSVFSGKIGVFNKKTCINLT